MITDDPQQASEYFQIALDMATTHLSKFYTCASLANSQYSARHYDTSIASTRIFLKLHNSFGTLSAVEDSEKIIYTKNLYDVFRVLEGSLYAHLSDVKGALEAYTQAREIVIESDYKLEDGKDGTYTLGKMCEILAEHKEWSNLVSKVASWSSQDCASWLCTDERYQKGQNEMFIRAASLSEQLNVMKKCYKDAIDTTDEDDDSENELLIRYQYAKASFHVLQDDDEAYHQLQNIVTNRDSGSVA
jgi:tetratricopeptide (TPR) repeat protein